MTAHRPQDPALRPLSLLALELHRFVSQVQRPRSTGSAWAEAARQRCRELAEGLVELREAAGRRKAEAGLAMERMAESLRSYRSELAELPTSRRLRQLGRRLAEDYEDLRAELRAFQRQDGGDVPRIPHVKPVTWARSVFHAVMGLTGLTLFHFVITRAQAITIMGTVTLLALTLEVTRRFSRRWNAFLVERVFGTVVRPWERHRTNSATWYTFGVTLLALLMPQTAAEIGLIALALGDPAASLIGRRWGHRKLWREKSLAGSLAFLTATFAVSALWLAAVAPQLPLATALGLPALVAAAGTAAELFSESLDDNFTIPVLCGGIAALWLG